MRWLLADGVLGESGQHFGVDQVGVEPPQFLGEQFRRLPAMQCHPPVRLARPLSVAMRPSGRDSVMSPSSVTKVTSVMPGPGEISGHRGVSLSTSQAAISSALGLASSALTMPLLISAYGWSSVAASSDRQGVARVQLRSVSPGR